MITDQKHNPLKLADLDYPELQDSKQFES